MSLFRRHKSPIASPDQFRILYEQSRLPLFRYIYSLTGGPQDHVEDLTAETFLRAWKARHRFEGSPDAAIGWLIRIAKRLVIDDYRRAQRAARNLPAEPVPEPLPEQAAVDGEGSKMLAALLASLSDEQREMVVLRYALDWPVKDIARHMEMTENNVSVTLHRTLARLRQQWAKVDSQHTLFDSTQKENFHETRSK